MSIFLLKRGESMCKIVHGELQSNTGRELQLVVRPTHGSLLQMSQEKYQVGWVIFCLNIGVNRLTYPQD